MTVSIFQTLAVIAISFLLPGWSLLSITGLWKKWPTLQRWCLAIGISIAFYPVFYYAVRELLPGFRLGANKIQLLFLLFFISIVYFQRKTWKEQFSFERFEWYTILVILGTLLTRFWAAQNNPFPAWTDLLHHTLITQLTAEQGMLPFTLEPFDPIPLNMYHLGLYSITGLVQQVAKISAYTSLIWVSQALNGLCGLGVFLVLDRIAGRRAAFFGTAVVGFFSHMPAFYVNWGRFTQVSGQTLLLIAWAVTLESVRSWKEDPWKENAFRLVCLTLIAAVLNAGTFLFHFRVAGFYLPLLILGLLWELWGSIRGKRVSKLIFGIGAVGLTSLVLIAPVLYRAGQAYGQIYRNASAGTIDAAQAQIASNIYFIFPVQTLFTLGVEPWLFALTCVAILVGIFFKNRWTWMFLAWVLVLWLEGNLYLLNIPSLSFTNMGAIIILLYMPVSLIIGIAVEELLCRVPISKRLKFDNYFLGVTLIMCFLLTNSRVSLIENFRFFITNEDVAAMSWIAANTPGDATFAINTFFWMPNSPHGADAGYWIPYFTRRRTTAGVMISNLGDATYREKLNQTSTLAKKLEEDNSVLDELLARGIEYVYIGEKGNFSGPGLDAGKIAQDPQAELVYSQKGVAIFKILAKSAGK